MGVLGVVSVYQCVCEGGVCGGGREECDCEEVLTENDSNDQKVKEFF